MSEPADAAGERVRVLVVRRRYLGDIVLLGSLLRNLRLQWPEAVIDVLAEPAFLPILGLNPDVNRALPMPPSSQWRALAALALQLRRARYTHVLDIDNTDKTALLAAASGAKHRLTFRRQNERVHFGRVYSAFVELPNTFYDTHHITETYELLLPAIGVPLRSHDVRLVPRPQDIAAMRELAAPLTAQRRRRVLLHPGSRNPARIWPVERFAAVCDRLGEQQEAGVVVVAGPREQELAAQIQKLARVEVGLINHSLSLPQLAALQTVFDVFLCHDSGPMHVAAAVGTPVVALLSSQNSRVWRPWGPGHTILQTELPCPCIGDEAPVPCNRNDSGYSYCVRRISIDQAHAAVASALARRQP